MRSLPLNLWAITCAVCHKTNGIIKSYCKCSSSSCSPSTCYSNLLSFLSSNSPNLIYCIRFPYSSYWHAILIANPYGMHSNSIYSFTAASAFCLWKYYSAAIECKILGLRGTRRYPTSGSILSVQLVILTHGSMESCHTSS